MEHHSPLPLSILIACVGGVLIAAFILVSGGGVLLAFAGYTVGGALVLVVTAGLLTLRNALHAQPNTIPGGTIADAT